MTLSADEWTLGYIYIIVSVLLILAFSVLSYNYGFNEGRVMQLQDQILRSQ